MQRDKEKIIIERERRSKKNLDELEPEFEEIEKEWKKLIIQIPNMISSGFADWER